jgi:hypothetical protein
MFRVNTGILKLAACYAGGTNAITVLLTADNTRKRGGSFAPGSIPAFSASINFEVCAVAIPPSKPGTSEHLYPHV